MLRFKPVKPFVSSSCMLARAVSVVEYLSDMRCMVKDLSTDKIFSVSSKDIFVYGDGDVGIVIGGAA